MEKITFRKADISDKSGVLALYDSVKSMELCTWNEYYPTSIDADADLAADCLFVLEDGDKLIGAASISDKNELDSAALWNCAEAREIARVVIAPQMQGRGLSEKLVKALLKEIEKGGAKAVHLAVAKINIPAKRCYKALGFKMLGEAEMYGGSYILCEKEL